MNEFASAVDNQISRTENGMKAFKDSSDACVDLFFKIGASRGENILPDFIKAFAENKDYALRILQWSRDIKEGAGERQIFKDILAYFEVANPSIAKALILRIPELGRWDDILINYKNPDVRDYAYSIYNYTLTAAQIARKMLANNCSNLSADLLNKVKTNLQKGKNAAKWAPRKGKIAVGLRVFGGWTHKEYRKVLVSLTDVVETKMCAKQWEDINFSNVPSLAAARYKKN